jgi:hypothetical protein
VIGMRHIVRALVVCSVLGLALSNACRDDSTSGRSVGTETNWLRACSVDDECGALDCICGVCTLACSATSPCPAAPAPESCAESGAALDALCGASARPSGMCIPKCANASTCESGLSCVDDFCIPSERIADAAVDGPGPGGAGGVSAGGEAGTPAEGGAGGAPSTNAVPVGTPGEVRCAAESCVSPAVCCYHPDDPATSVCSDVVDCPVVAGNTPLTCDSQMGGCSPYTFCCWNGASAVCSVVCGTSETQLCDPALPDPGECQMGSCQPYTAGAPPLVPAGYYACQ